MISLYDAIVPTFVQILRSTHGVIEKARDFTKDRGMPQEDILAARLADDMHPLSFQLQAAIAHSKGAIEGATVGRASPDRSEFPSTLDGVAARLAEAVAAIEKVTREEVDTLQGRPVAYVVGERQIDFVAESYLLSFAQPNFFFHATTSYVILRHLGVPIGKRDYLGQMRTRV